MDQLSEIEVKFDGTGLEGNTNLDEFVYSLLGRGWTLDRYRTAHGFDTFYKLGTGIVRHRQDIVTRPYSGEPPEPSQFLTVKARKDAGSLLDRHEVDIEMKPPTGQSVPAFVGMLGGTHYFEILKTYRIWWIERAGVHVCLAYYKAENTNIISEPDYLMKEFLEAEVERTSKCTPARAKEVLAELTQLIKDNLGCEGPLNVSLMEVFKPK